MIRCYLLPSSNSFSVEKKMRRNKSNVIDEKWVMIDSLLLKKICPRVMSKFHSLLLLHPSLIHLEMQIFLVTMFLHRFISLHFDLLDLKFHLDRICLQQMFDLSFLLDRIFQRKSLPNRSKKLNQTTEAKEEKKHFFILFVEFVKKFSLKNFFPSIVRWNKFIDINVQFFSFDDQNHLDH